MGLARPAVGEHVSGRARMCSKVQEAIHPPPGGQVQTNPGSQTIVTLPAGPTPAPASAGIVNAVTFPGGHAPAAATAMGHEASVGPFTMMR